MVISQFLSLSLVLNFIHLQIKEKKAAITAINTNIFAAIFTHYENTVTCISKLLCLNGVSNASEFQFLKRFSVHCQKKNTKF